MMGLISTRITPVIVTGLMAVLMAGCGDARDPRSGGPMEEASSGPQGAEIVEMHASWYHYQSTDDLLSRADLVVEGVILDSRVEIINTYIPSDGTDPNHPQYGLSEDEVQEVRDSLDAVVTVYTVRAASSPDDLRSNSETVEVWLPGGQYEGVEYRIDGVPTFPTGPDGKKYLFVLAASGPEGMTAPVNPHQGIYTVDRNGAYIALDRATNDLVISARDVDEFRATSDE